MTNDRRGFSLVELLVVSVLGSLLLMATYQILITNQQTYRQNAEQVKSQQSGRMVLDFLTSEIREAGINGDLIAATQNGVQFRRPNRFGIVCEVLYPGGVISAYQLKVRKYDAWFENGDSVMIFADNDVQLTNDDAWVFASVTAVDSTNVTCGGETAQQLTFGTQLTLFQSDSVRTGAPIRAFDRAAYSELTQDSMKWVGRRLGNGSAQAMAGPIRRILFSYLDTLGSPLTHAGGVYPADDVNQILITVISDSDTLTAHVFPRN